MKKRLVIGAVFLLIIAFLAGCASPAPVIQSKITTAEELVTAVNKMAESITSYEYNNEANAIRLFEGKGELSTHVTENRLVAIEEERGRLESVMVTSSRQEGKAEGTETRRQSTYIKGNKVYFRQAVDEEVMDYSQVDDAEDAINVINILSEEIKLMNSSNVTLLPDIENVQGVECYVVSLSIDSNMLMGTMIIPSFYEAMSHDINDFLPYLDNYVYKLWFSAENMRLLKVYQYMQLGSDEAGNSVKFTYEWNKEFTRYNETLDILIPGEASEVVIHDSLLAREIRKFLGKPTGTITTDDLALLKELDLGHIGVNSISGLEYCINLEGLVLSIGGDRPDVSPLASLTKLKNLELSAPGKTDLSPLSHLTNLTSLELSSLDPFDISPILTLPNITELNLDWHTSFDITQLKAFPKLTSLTLNADRDITDLTPLTNFFNLTKLALRVNEVKDISPLTHLQNLQHLSLIDSSLTDISPLTELHMLVSLQLDIDNDADFSPVSQMKSLKGLNLAGHKIYDTNIFGGLVNLQSLILSGNKISYTTPFSNLINLKELDLSHNNIADITPLSKLQNLIYLDLSSNAISDITPLSSLITLQNLSISYIKTQDISPLSSLTNIRVLDLVGNGISDISVMANFKYLEELNLTNNNVTDISPLRNLPALHNLSIWKNPVTDITPLVENPGLGTGDEVTLDADYINEKIQEGIKILESRGVKVNIY